MKYENEKVLCHSYVKWLPTKFPANTLVILTSGESPRIIEMMQQYQWQTMEVWPPCHLLRKPSTPNNSFSSTIFRWEPFPSRTRGRLLAKSLHSSRSNSQRTIFAWSWPPNWPTSTSFWPPWWKTSARYQRIRWITTWSIIWNPGTPTSSSWSTIILLIVDFVTLPPSTFFLSFFFFLQNHQASWGDLHAATHRGNFEKDLRFSPWVEQKGTAGHDAARKGEKFMWPCKLEAISPCQIHTPLLITDRWRTDLWKSVGGDGAPFLENRRSLHFRKWNHERCKSLHQFVFEQAKQWLMYVFCFDFISSWSRFSWARPSQSRRWPGRSPTFLRSSWSYRERKVTG